MFAADNRRLYRQIADRIARSIERGDYVAGERLPPERELARELGVSRPSLREALIALEVSGYVEARSGSGIYVLPEPVREPEPAAAPTGTEALIAARALIEGECAALAARNARREDILAIQRAAIGERAASARAAERAFHLRVAEASGDADLVRIAMALWGADAEPVTVPGPGDPATGSDSAVALRRRVAAAIAMRDAPAAREAMRREVREALARPLDERRHPAEAD